MSLVVLKLGGSVVTDKDELETIDKDGLAAAADAVATLAESGQVVVVHGAGSFGHPHAADHDVSSDTGTHDEIGVRAIHDAMKRLNDAVLDALAERGVSALPVHPLSAGARETDGSLSLSLAATETMLAEGFVPVLHGDVIAHAGEGATIVSGDDLVVSLASGLDADRVGLCSTVPGVLDTDGAVIPEITAFADAADALGGSESTDVTGGMAAKVRKLLALGAPAHVFGPDGLSAFVAGESPGTVIRGE
ncbi:isopentenyl phosphate kinase family protein [Haloferax mediterranei ATCC 33500]|uniref:Isopentenyl phosphate kinase n=1 Tax=Haloferax mediterranei (strain ATCC 33500 / DSM 1411 / JCM 8866 / NBRC 14739 / NCIMB 2177 / R-4) TaxID=523841 RepID=I3R890_HALMT|nr:isopentenyl phosphate kinase [Haloferax mediterranei]AFK20450.1 isopentenyl phosphate kinase [Haloferax mediterranei ATCC 33500]AHZ23811.1 acetylglutamate kinase [Haloferax mediterranei ATCC 33500]ELZ98234.1 isopentenyl phosphate kinase [Haloferax mediterranei ATCC 33500]MDX5986794.1 isopentenyl phosphate kinase [Haloferax mediterranei ATCC 33500]QCQ76118.1 isopentenyl phosphate kinase family protein [Haloferax mediterranei ATCC 33500]